MPRKKREQDLRTVNPETWDDGPGSLGIALPRGAEMGLRLYRLVGGGTTTGHTLEVECWEIGTKIYIRLDKDGELRVIQEDESGRHRLTYDE